MLSKKITALLFVIVVSLYNVIAQEKINWIHMGEVEEAVKAHPKKIMVDVYTQWCGPCKMMSNQTFTNPDVVKYMNENYHCVKFDAESGDPVTFKGKTFTNPDFKPGTTGRNGVHQLTMELGVSAYPTLIFFDENLNPIAPITGYQSVENFEIFAKVFATNDYRNITSADAWTAYQKSFVRTWGAAPAPVVTPLLAPEKKVGPSAIVIEQYPDTNDIDLEYQQVEAPQRSEEPVEDKIYEFVEENPIFSQGDVQQYIAKHVKYPRDAMENEIQGTVYLSFVIDKTGKVKDVKILRGIPGGGSLEKEALNVVKSLPNFTPAKQNGQPVSMKMTIPIKFLLK
jgi:TonB family protein